MKRPVRDTARDARGNTVISKPQRRYMLRLLTLETSGLRDGASIPYPTRDILTKRGWVERIPKTASAKVARLSALGYASYRLTPMGKSIARRLKDGTM